MTLNRNALRWQQAKQEKGQRSSKYVKESKVDPVYGQRGWTVERESLANQGHACFSAWSSKAVKGQRCFLAVRSSSRSICARPGANYGPNSGSRWVILMYIELTRGMIVYVPARLSTGRHPHSWDVIKGSRHTSALLFCWHAGTLTASDGTDIGSQWLNWLNRLLLKF